MAAAIARAKAKKAAVSDAPTEKPVTAEPAEAVAEDPRKAAVAAAIARAKAKKAAVRQNAGETATDEAVREAEQEVRATAEMATRARANVEQAEQAEEQANNAHSEPEQAPELNQPEDARKAAIAAAIARAKARKAQSTSTFEE